MNNLNALSDQVLLFSSNGVRQFKRRKFRWTCRVHLKQEQRRFGLELRQISLHHA